MPPLTALKVKSIDTPGRYRDQPTLYLYVKPNLSKSWVQRIMVNGRRGDLGLGPYPLVTLAQARQKAEHNRLMLLHGEDPTAPPSSDLPTFSEAAHLYHQAHLPVWRTDRQQKNWLNRLTKYAFPHIGHTPIDQVTQSQILDILLPIWTTKPETGRKVRQYISAVFKTAMSRQWRPDNPAGQAIDAALPNHTILHAHHPALPYSQVAAAIHTINDTNAHPTSKLCFNFLVLTATRFGEARGATWEEVLLPGREWRIPPERTKTTKPHRVPLSDQAVALLHQAQQYQDHTGLLFPTPTGRQISDSTLSKLLRENNVPAVPHGFRSSFRDWGGDTLRVNSDALEISLAHEIGNTTKRSYTRSDLYTERKEIFELWGEFLRPDPAQSHNK